MYVRIGEIIVSNIWQARAASSLLGFVCRLKLKRAWRAFSLQCSSDTDKFPDGDKTVEQHQLQHYPTPSISIQHHPTPSIFIQHYSKPSSTAHMQSSNIKNHQRLLKNVQTRPAKFTNIQYLQHCWHRPTPSNNIQQHSTPFNNIQKRHWNPTQDRPTFFSNV